MSITEERRVQAIISEHYLDPLHVDKVYKTGPHRGLYLTIGTRVKITKIPAMIKRIAGLTKTRVVSFKIGKSYDLLYYTDYDAFMTYKVQKNLTGSTTRYAELPEDILMMHLKHMKGSNRAT